MASSLNEVARSQLQLSPNERTMNANQLNNPIQLSSSNSQCSPSSSSNISSSEDCAQSANKQPASSSLALSLDDFDEFNSKKASPTLSRSSDRDDDDDSRDKCSTELGLEPEVGGAEKPAELLIGGSPSEEPTIELRFLVRRREAGAVIGKRGNNIKRLRETFRSSMFSIPDTGNGPERVVCIVTNESCLDGILKDISELMREKSPENDEQIELKLLIHSSHAGSLIGLGGQSIKKLRNVSSLPCQTKTFN